jgi:hypothetical protein
VKKPVTAVRRVVKKVDEVLFVVMRSVIVPLAEVSEVIVLVPTVRVPTVAVEMVVVASVEVPVTLKRPEMVPFVPETVILR